MDGKQIPSLGTRCFGDASDSGHRRSQLANELQLFLPEADLLVQRLNMDFDRLITPSKQMLKFRARFDLQLVKCIDLSVGCALLLVCHNLNLPYTSSLRKLLVNLMMIW